MDAYHKDTFRQTLCLLKSGDEKAFREVYDLFYAPLIRRLGTFLRDDVLVQEVVQETFIQLWVQRDRLDETKELSAWLFTIAKRKAIDVLRRQVKQALAIEEIAHNITHAPSADQRTIRKEEIEQLDRLLALLPEQQRQVLELAKLHELSYDEVADRLNISKNTVRNHLVNAMKVLKYKTSIFFIFFLF